MVARRNPTFVQWLVFWIASRGFLRLSSDEGGHGVFAKLESEVEGERPPVACECNGDVDIACVLDSFSDGLHGEVTNESPGEDLDCTWHPFPWGSVRPGESLDVVDEARKARERKRPDKIHISPPLMRALK